MAWDTTLVTMVRVMINDLSDEPTYSDERLQQLIVVAAQYVLREITFSTAYSVAIDVPSISPDPTLPETLDDDFSMFIVLKAACLADYSTYRARAALEGIRARLGPGEIHVMGNSGAFLVLLEGGACKAYEELKMQYMFGGKNMLRCAQAILSPFVSNTFDPLYNLSPQDSRAR